MDIIKILATIWVKNILVKFLAEINIFDLIHKEEVCLTKEEEEFRTIIKFLWGASYRFVEETK